MDTNCCFCNEDPRELRGQRFDNLTIGKSLHMKCLQKEFILNKISNKDNLSHETKILCNQYRDLIQRVAPEFEGFKL